MISLLRRLRFFRTLDFQLTTLIPSGLGSTSLDVAVGDHGFHDLHLVLQVLDLALVLRYLIFVIIVLLLKGLSLSSDGLQVL